MTREQFWVIGGDYTCMGFKALKDGARHVEGPFASRDQARSAWKKVSGEHSSRATTRFTIAAEQINLPH